jgi:ATP-binding cassette subfamily C protein CydD
VKSFGASRREAGEIEKASEEYRRATMSVLRIAFVSSFLLELISTVSVAIVAVICGLRLLSGGMAFGPGYFILLVAPEYFLTLRTLGTFYHSRMEAVSAADHIRGLLETPAAALPVGGAALPAGRAPPAITFHRVTFSYPGRPVLDEASFRLEGGEHVAIAGASGAGKSTILFLLLGFAAPQEGAIAIDGAALPDLSMPAWRERVAWLPQRPTLFHGTIGENIRLGRLSASDAEVREAAARARVDEFVRRLPDGLDTAVAERGQTLSGGQIQRVALARLFLRDPGLVLLDEPTAHLDEESARLMREGIRALADGRTMVLTTHRTADWTGRILELCDGAVRELR